MPYVRKGCVISIERKGKLKKKITCASIEEAKEAMDILEGPKGEKDSDGELKKESNGPDQKES